jgi:hypothetical protein
VKVKQQVARVERSEIRDRFIVARQARIALRSIRATLAAALNPPASRHDQSLSEMGKSNAAMELKP